MNVPHSLRAPKISNTQFGEQGGSKEKPMEFFRFVNLTLIFFTIRQVFFFQAKLSST